MRQFLWFACAMAVMIAGLFPAAVSALQLDGNQLFELCSARSQVCAGYVLGVADSRDGDQHGIQFCIPDGTSKEQLQDVVTAYLRKNSQRGFPGSLLVSAAFAEKFQCPN
jgi:hypothetical protein